MIDPYRMVFVNGIASLLVLTGVIIYRYVYPKRKINLFILLLIISILPIISIFRIGTYESGDFNIHVRRSMEFYQLLAEGNIIPAWAGNLNATYGYPLFVFNYTLPYYIISFFHLLGFSFISSLKLFLAFNFVLSGLFMYLFSKNFFKSDLSAFTTSIFYLFTPYHLISLHFKITVGEVLAYTFVPLIFYFVDKLLVDKKVLFFLLSSLSHGLLILSHIFVAIFLIPVIILYIIIKVKNFFKGILYSFGIITISLLISMYQWTAPLIYRPYLFTTTNPSDPSKAFYFPNIVDLLYSPWRFGLLFQGPKGELSFLLGYAQLLTVLIIISLLLKNRIKKEYKNSLILWVILFFVTIFFITPYSIFVWRHLPLVNEAGSQRLLIIAAFYTSLFAGYISLAYKKKWYIYGLVFFVIGTTILNWGQRRVIPTINDSTLRQDISLGTKWADTHFYALPKWIDPKYPWFSNIPKNHFEILNGEGKIDNVQRSSTKHIYKISAKSELTIRENTLYFPGWEIKANRKTINLWPDKKGVINFKIKTGTYYAEVIYEDLLIYKLSKVISLLSLLSIFLFILHLTLKKYKIFKL